MSIESIQKATIGASQSQSAMGSLSKDLDTFLVLLTTQLQNQDPLSPLKSEEFTNQLVAFANVEQSIAQSGYLEDLISLQKSNEVTSAVNYIGRTVEMQSDQFYMFEGDGTKFSYTLPEKAANAMLIISDKDGKVVYQGKAATETGEHIYEWDGKLEDGTSHPSGVYKVAISAVNADSQPVPDILYHTTGKVTGVEYGNSKTTLIMSGVPIDLGKVTAVVEGDK